MTAGFFGLFGFDLGVFTWHSDYAKDHFKEIQDVTAPSSEVKRNKSNFICTKEE